MTIEQINAEYQQNIENDSFGSWLLAGLIHLAGIISLIITGV